MPRYSRKKIVDVYCYEYTNNKIYKSVSKYQFDKNTGIYSEVELTSNNWFYDYDLDKHIFTTYGCNGFREYSLKQRDEEFKEEVGMALSQHLCEIEKEYRKLYDECKALDSLEYEVK